MEVDVGATADAVDQPCLASLSEALPTDVGSQPDASVVAQPLLTPDATITPTASQTLATNLAHGQPEWVPAVAADPGYGPSSALQRFIHTSANTTLTRLGLPAHYASSSSALSFTATRVASVQKVPVSSTTEKNTIPRQTGLTISTTSSGSPNTSQTKAIVGGVSGASLILILGAILLCILRRKRRYRAARSAFTQEVLTSSDIPGQSTPQSSHLSTTPQPFLDFRLTQNQPPPKGILAGHASLLAQNNQVDIEQAADPFRDPVPAAGNSSNNDDEVQRVRDTLDRLRALTSRCEREVQQLGVLAKSGLLSAEDRLRLAEIGGTTGLGIPSDSSPDRISMARSSSGSSSSLPSYHTDGN